MSFTVTTRRDVSTPARGDVARSAARAVRFVVATTLVVAGVFVLVNEASLRIYEAQVGALLAELLFATESRFVWSLDQPSIAFAMDGVWRIARVTVACAIGLYVGPVLILGGIFTVMTRSSSLRILTATAVGAAALLLLNQARLLAIEFAWGTWGTRGFHWVHGPIGTVLMLLGLASVLLLFLRVATARARPAGRRA